MVTAQPSTGRLQKGGLPEPCPVSTGPRDRDSQACVPISVPQHLPVPPGSFGPTWSSTKFLATRDQGQWEGGSLQDGPQESSMERRVQCVPCTSTGAQGGQSGGPQLGGHAFLATGGPGSSGVLQNLTPERCLVLASGPVDNSSPGQAPRGAQLWREGTSSGRTPVSPSLENTDPQRDRAGGLCPTLAPH